MSYPQLMLSSSLPLLEQSFGSRPSSSHSYSRPQSAHGIPVQNGLGHMQDPSNPYQHQYPQVRPQIFPPHSRNSSSATSFSLPSTGLISPADSPPSHVSQNPLLKNNPLAARSTIRKARTGISPYPRDPHIHSGSESVHSSSSETEDMSLYHLQQQHHQEAYHNMYVHPSVGHIDPMQSIQHAQPYRPVTMQPDNGLEQLANNVRTATTTSASDRAKQIFVHAWLNANYTPYAEGNVPRQGLYYSYRRICDQYGIPHMNTATLGKAIRLCFPNIKTRRLGVRGNSKYHYCGIRPSNATEAEWLQEYIRKSNNLTNQGQDLTGVDRSNSRSSRGSAGPEHGSQSDEEDEVDSPDGHQSGNTSKRGSLNLDGAKLALAGASLDDKTPTTNSLLSAAQGAPGLASTSGYQSAIRRQSANLGDPVFSGHPSLAGQVQASPITGPSPHGGAGYLSQSSSIRHLPSFPKIDEALGGTSSPQAIVAREVWTWFEDHLDVLLDHAKNFRYDQIEPTLRSFWSSLQGDHREVLHAPTVASLVSKADALLYDEILEALRSQILAPIPQQTIANLRGLADQMEKILVIALEGYGASFVEPKVELGARFGHLVLRFLDIYQVTQALGTVLQNPKQLADMRRAWSQIDFESVRNQSALVCNCRHEDLVQLLEVEFGSLLERLQRTPEPVREVLVWADACTEKLMGAGRDERSTVSSRSILIRWGYVTSQIMRDLTIRSDPAFGAFQILKLFLDDWIALSVLRTVALSTNSVAASVEPVIQQQFFTLSPAIGSQDYNAQAAVQPGIMDHTPTAGAMLSTLQDNSFVQNGANNYSLSNLNYIDPSGMTTSNDTGLITPIGSVHGMSFSDFNATNTATYDVGSFGQEYVMSTTAEPEQLLTGVTSNEESVKVKEDDVVG